MSADEDCFICQKHQGPMLPGGPLIFDDHVVASHRGVEGEDETMYRGWCLVEPRRHVARLGDLTDPEAAALGVAANRMARALKQVFGVEQIYSFVLGDGIGRSHLHVHLVPRHLDTPGEIGGLAIVDWAEKPMIDEIEIAALSVALGVALRPEE